MEVEVRAKIEESKSIEEGIKRLGFKLAYEGHQNDVYFKSANSEKKFLLRIREKDDKKELTYKGLTNADGVWKEFTTGITNTSETRKILQESEFYEWMVIEKIRKSYKSEEIEVNIDNFKQPSNFGLWVEAEILTEKPEEGKKRIKEFLSSLGIDKNKFVERGYPQLIEDMGLLSKPK